MPEVIQDSDSIYFSPDSLHLRAIPRQKTPNAAQEPSKKSAQVGTNTSKDNVIN